MIVWYLIWLSIVLAVDTASNIFSELVNLRRSGRCLREHKRHSSSGRIAFKSIINMLIYFVRAWTISFEIFHHLISDSFVKLFLSVNDNKMQKICKTYVRPLYIKGNTQGRVPCWIPKHLLLPEESWPPPGPPKDKCRIEAKNKTSFKNIIVLHCFKSNFCFSILLYSFVVVLELHDKPIKSE